MAARTGSAKLFARENAAWASNRRVRFYIFAQAESAITGGGGIWPKLFDLALIRFNFRFA
ncbi:hypothetical protein [Crenobacter cavernae]|uniref:Uncharacterized protein n=1 Tax=Crenobacter cavernae TaxID=2290923 RepID=A0A345Y9S9_9NEIS|nr:hypothetical protein [Crenobacter cavernae]AXK40681.1 hypothetical protein DWG20_15320 [Crenobacter cavernae]